jgi:soluble lytic murein transglycosylase-like protein
MHWLRVTAGILGAICAPACLADSGIYTFADDQGQVYLSNVPDDSRYHMLDPATAAPGLQPGDAAERNAALDPAQLRRYGNVVAQAAGRYGIDAALLHAVISVESGYNAKAVSKRGAAGLMQLMPETARRYGVADVFDPADNVRAGAQYLTDLLKLFDNDVRLALAAYNAGEAAVIKYGRRVPPYRETTAYVPRVVGFYERFKSLM